jgi:hypothetical protein
MLFYFVLAVFAPCHLNFINNRSDNRLLFLSFVNSSRHPSSLKAFGAGDFSPNPSDHLK